MRTPSLEIVSKFVEPTKRRSRHCSWPTFLAPERRHEARPIANSLPGPIAWTRETRWHLVPRLLDPVPRMHLLRHLGAGSRNNDGRRGLQPYSKLVEAG